MVWTIAILAILRSFFVEHKIRWIQFSSFVLQIRLHLSFLAKSDLIHSDYKADLRILMFAMFSFAGLLLNMGMISILLQGKWAAFV